MARFNRKTLAILVLVGGPGAVIVDRVFLADKSGATPHGSGAAGGGIVNAAMNAVVQHAVSNQALEPGVADALSGLLNGNSSPLSSPNQASGFGDMSELFGAVAAGPNGLNPAPAAPVADPGYRVSAVMTVGAGAAIINGKVVRTGESVGDAVLVSVEERTAILRIGGVERVFSVQ